MITLTIILLLIFVPATRKILGGLFWNLFSLVGLMFLITRSGERRRF